MIAVRKEDLRMFGGVEEDGEEATMGWGGSK
jgi:hypothetical protein